MPGTIGIDKRETRKSSDRNNMCCDVLAVMVRLGIGGGLEIVMFDLLGYLTLTESMANVAKRRLTCFRF